MCWLMLFSEFQETHYDESKFIKMKEDWGSLGDVKVSCCGLCLCVGCLFVLQYLANYTLQMKQSPTVCSECSGNVSCLIVCLSRLCLLDVD